MALGKRPCLHKVNYSLSVKFTTNILKRFGDESDVFGIHLSGFFNDIFVYHSVNTLQSANANYWVIIGTR